MKTAALFLFVTFVSVAAETPAFAQRAPASGMWAVGGSVGASAPADPSLQSGLEVAANLENYLTPRLSIRGQVGVSSWDVTGRGFTGTVKPVRLDGNLVYNWEGGEWHPYVTAGVGMYHYASNLSGGVSGSDTEAGLNAGGGIEYFFRRRTAFTAEALYHHAGAFNTPLATFGNGSYWTFDVGLKAYLKR